MLRFKSTGAWWDGVLHVCGSFHELAVEKLDVHEREAAEADETVLDLYDNLEQLLDLRLFLLAIVLKLECSVGVGER